MPKYIVVAGGVISGVGKGVATAAVGKILQQYGFKVTAVKIDPYINYDAGTLRPTEHGEVWVTDDGGEIDQDLGNYERFLGMDIPKRNNLTTGQVYKEVIDRERRGEFLGKTVQFIPHIPDEIKRRLKEAGKGFDFVLVEIGGTIGDYENIPFLFAMKSLEREVKEHNLAYMMVTYLPVPGHIDEMKTKPTQQAIKMLSENGIFPDFILCRARKALDKVRKQKIETYANMVADHVISAPDVKTIYAIPLNFEKEKLGAKIMTHFGVKPRRKPNWEIWKTVVNNIRHPKKTAKVALICKYIDIGDFTLADSYVSINESLKHAGAAHNTGIEIIWMDAKTLENDPDAVAKLSEYDGLLIPGGFGGSGVEGKIKAIQYARENDIPFLGLCYGMQLAVVEFARNVCGMTDAHTTEVFAKTKHPVIDIQPSQKKLMAENRYGGTMRLGAYAAIMDKKSKVCKLYEERGRVKDDVARVANFNENKKESYRLGILKKGQTVVLERHRHRYEVSPRYIEQIEKKGLKFSGYHHREDGTKLMEFIEIKDHSFFMATQAHPEFKSRIDNPAPMFYGFVEAISKKIK